MSTRYDLEHLQVLVTWEEILPTSKALVPEKTVVFLPGWPLKEGPVQGMRRIGEAFANTFGARTYLIYTQSKQIVAHSMYYHAEAICKFLIEKGITSIILAGHSQGGIKAIDTIARLQEMHSNIHVEGLILINSSGLNDINGWTFLRRQIVDLTIKTWLMILKESVRQPSLRKKFSSLRENIAVLGGSRDFLFALWIDMKPSLRAFFARFINEVVEGTTRSPYLDQVGVPVIIVQGAKDRSFDTDRILTQGKAHSTAPQRLKARAKELAKVSNDTIKQLPVENLFPHSSHVTLLRAQKFGAHLLPFFRPDAVAQASLYMLRDPQKRKDRCVSQGKASTR